MAGFRTQQERTKWDSLQSVAKGSIDKILAGMATPNDIKALSTLLRQQHDLAGKIFDRGVTDAEKTADTIVDKLNAGRVEVGKAPLSAKAHERLFTRTFLKVLSASVEDIVGSIKDELDGKLGEHQAALDSAYDRIRRFVASKETGTQPTNTIERVSRIVQPQRSTPASSTNPVQVPTPAQPEASEKEPMWKRISRITRSVSARAVTTAANAGHATVTYGRELAKSVATTAANTKARLSEIFQRMRRPADEDEDEDKRASKWMRKLKMFFDPIARLGRKAKDVGWVSNIGKALLFALMNPKLIGTITDEIKQYLNFDSISGFLNDTWKEVKSGGEGVVKWIVDKVKGFFSNQSSAAVPSTSAAVKEINDSVARNSAIPANTTAADAQAAIPRIQKHLELSKANLARAEQRMKADPSPENKVAVSHVRQRMAILQNQLAQYQAKLTGAPAPAMVMPSMAGIMPEQKAIAGSDTKPVGSLSNPPPPMATTRVVPDAPAVYRDGMVVAPNKALDKATGGSNPQASALNSQVSLGSFGYTSGDDTFNLINLGVIS